MIQFSDPDDLKKWLRERLVETNARKETGGQEGVDVGGGRGKRKEGEGTCVARAVVPIIRGCQGSRGGGDDRNKKQGGAGVPQFLRWWAAAASHYAQQDHREHSTQPSVYCTAETRCSHHARTRDWSIQARSSRAIVAEANANATIENRWHAGEYSPR